MRRDNTEKLSGGCAAKRCEGACGHHALTQPFTDTGWPGIPRTARRPSCAALTPRHASPPPLRPPPPPCACRPRAWRPPSPRPHRLSRREANIEGAQGQWPRSQRYAACSSTKARPVVNIRSIIITQVSETHAAVQADRALAPRPPTTVVIVVALLLLCGSLLGSGLLVLVAVVVICGPEQSYVVRVCARCQMAVELVRSQATRTMGWPLSCVSDSCSVPGSPLAWAKCWPLPAVHGDSYA